jgi:hypothetical protein
MEANLIDLSHLAAVEIDDFGNLTDYGVEKIKQRVAAAKAAATVRRRYHTEFYWVKPEFPIYSAGKELVNEAEPRTTCPKQTRSMEVSDMEALRILRQRIATL